jgi:hypothetical protein
MSRRNVLPCRFCDLKPKRLTRHFHVVKSERLTRHFHVVKSERLGLRHEIRAPEVSREYIA